VCAQLIETEIPDVICYDSAAQVADKTQFGAK
jgi:hypothetical protein